MIWIAVFCLYVAIGWYLLEMPKEFDWWQKVLLRVFWLPVVVFLMIVFSKGFKL